VAARRFGRDKAGISEQIGGDQRRPGPVHGRPGRRGSQFAGAPRLSHYCGFPRVEHPGAVPLQHRGREADQAGRRGIIVMTWPWVADLGLHLDQRHVGEFGER
jgi:hypothetical protein